MKKSKINSMDISVNIDNIIFNYRVGLIIKDKDKLLVETNINSRNVFIPGGRVKALEDTKECLIREMKEEMNISFYKKDLELLCIFENFFTHNNIQIHELFLAYKLNNLASYDIVVNKNQDSENNYYKWIKIKDLKSVNLLPEKLIDVIKKDQFSHVISRDEK